MGRIKLAWRVLMNKQFADQVAAVSSGSAAIDATPQPKTEPKPPKPEPPARSEALTLLAALQRDARLIDFIKEPIDGYNDAQVGAAVREVHRECGTTLNRLFAIRPLRDESEGADIALGEDVEAGRIRLTGNVSNDRPESGQLVHHGWEAEHCEIPKWNGADDTALVLSPAEVEAA